MNPRFSSVGSGSEVSSTRSRRAMKEEQRYMEAFESGTGLAAAGFARLRYNNLNMIRSGCVFTACAAARAYGAQ